METCEFCGKSIDSHYYDEDGNYIGYTACMEQIIGSICVNEIVEHQ